MKDDGSPKGLKSEWSLFLSHFIDSDEDISSEQVDYQIKKIGFIDTHEIQAQIKQYSSVKKDLNKKIESVKKQIDERQRVIENLDLVGSDTSEINQEIDQLIEQGQELSLRLQDIDRKIKKIRSIELQYSLSK